MRFPRKWNAVVALGILQTVSRFASFTKNITKKQAYSVISSCQYYVFSPIYEPLCTITNPVLLQAKSRLIYFIGSGCLAPPHFNVWSCGILCRLVIGFGLELDFLSILVAKKGCNLESVAAVCDNLLRRGTFVLDSPGSDELHSGDDGRCGSDLA